MILTIDGGILHLNGVAVRYARHYLSEAVLKDVLTEWTRRLGGEPVHGRRVYLPFSIDDEFIEAFEVEGDAEISLRVVKLDGKGYVPGVDPLMEAILGDSDVVQRRSEPFLICQRAMLLEAVERFLSQR